MTRLRGTHPVYWQTLSVQPPSDWKIERIEDYAEVKKGKLPKTLYTIPTEDSLPYLLIDGLNEGEPLYTDDTNLPMIDENDTVMVADGSRSGLPIRGVSGALGSTLLRFRAKEDFDPDFLYYVLESLYPYTNTATIGGAVPHLDKRLLAQLELATPRQEERKRIGFIIILTDRLLRRTEEQLKAALRLKTSLMQQLFTKGIPAKHKKFKEAKWTKTPENWEYKKLSDIGEISSGFTMGRDLTRHETVAVQYITVNNVKEGYLDLSDVGQVEVKTQELESLRLKSGDILMTEGGDRDKLGRGSIWNGEIETCVYQNHIFRIRLELNTYLPELFHFLLQTYPAKNYFFSHAKQTSNLCTINSRELKRFPVFIPSADEQKEMLDLLTSMESTIFGIREKHAALLRLKKSLMQNLLTGKVRVNMEAAHELLRGKDG